MSAIRLKLVGRIMVSAGLLAWLASRLDWPVLARQFAGLDGGCLLWVMLLSPLCLLLLTGRWRLFLQARGLNLPYIDLLQILWGGQFCNTFLPGAVGGDIYKAVAIGRRQPHAQVEAATTVLLDRFCALLTLGALAIVGFSVERAPLRAALDGKIAWPHWLLPAALGGGLLVVTAAAFGWHWTGRTGRREAVWGAVKRAGQTLLIGVRDWRTMTLASSVSLVIHLANFAIFFLLARALHIGIGFGQVVLIMPVVLFVAMLPVTVNGHGLREILLIGYFRWLHPEAGAGIGPAEAAVAVSLLYVANDLLWNLPGGIWLILRRAKPAPIYESQ